MSNLSIKKIDVMRHRVLKNLQDLETNKYLIKSHDLTKLMNHHNYILSTLDNMISIQKVERSDPYNSYNSKSNSSSSSNSNSTIVYNRDGTTKVVSKDIVHNSKNEAWESLFDQKLLVTPPNTMIPPQYLTNITRINNTRKTQMFEGH